MLALLGTAVWLLAVWWPAYRTGSAPPLAALDAGTLNLVAGGALLLVALAAWYQWFVLIARSGTVLFLLTAALLIVLPAALGGYYNIPGLLAISPLGLVMTELTSDLVLPIWPFCVLYGLIWLGSWWQLRRRLAAHAAAIGRKLAEMGVEAQAAPQSNRSGAS